jgi:hypothetical protein
MSNFVVLKLHIRYIEIKHLQQKSAITRQTNFLDL